MESLAGNQNIDGFDLRIFAEAMPPIVTSYGELQQTVEPKFRMFLAGLRERLRTIKKPGMTVIVVLGTGGTFQSVRTANGYAPGGSLGESIDALHLEQTPAVHLEPYEIFALDSAHMTVEQWRFLAEMIRLLEETAGDMYDGIIVTHGTDTMTKGASYLSFMLKGFPKSIIFTGSQQPARKEGTDARDNMERSILTARLANQPDRKIAEVMVACGVKVSRATWAAKLGDTTTHTFGPWNEPHKTFDATEYEEAAQNGTLAKLTPALLDFGTGKSRDQLRFAGHARAREAVGNFEPFTAITRPADLYRASLSDKSRTAFARHLIAQRMAILTQLGSATADDGLVEIGLAAVKCGKLAFFDTPFPDSSVPTGTYAAGSGASRVLPNIGRRIPVINTSPSAVEAKANYLLHALNLQPEGETDGLGVYYSSRDVRKFFDEMERNLVGELV